MVKLVNYLVKSPNEWDADDLAEIAREIDHKFPPDLGIVRAVKILPDVGIGTVQSCEGGEGHSYPEPTVEFVGGRSENWKAAHALLQFGLPIRRMGQIWKWNEGVPEGPIWAVTFWKKLV
jgi:hypothetical protein